MWNYVQKREKITVFLAINYVYVKYVSKLVRRNSHDFM